MESDISQRSLIFLLSSIGMMTLPHINNIPIVLFAWFVLLLSWRFIGVWNSRWLPDRRVLFFITLASIYLLYSQHEGILGRDAGTQLFIISLGLKLLEIRRPRDIYLIVFLAFIVAASLFLYEQSLVMAAYIALVCVALFTTLIALNSEKIKTLAAVKTAATILLQAIPLTVILFVMFPRLEAPRWMLFEDKSKGLTGLSDKLQPGSISDLAMSDALVFRARFEGAIPPPQQRYWRGPIYAQTDGINWTSPPASFGRFTEPLKAQGQAYRYTLLMEPQKYNWVFALEMAVNVEKPLDMTTLYQVTTRKNPTDRAEYVLTSYPEYNTGAISDLEKKANLQLPRPPSARIKQFIQQLDGFNTPPHPFIERLLNHFRTEQFFYTLQPPLMKTNPVEEFLFETRQGFCSHYATTFVYLMRAAGIPARVVGGYQGGELNKVGNFLEIRQAHAHAWAEVWLSGQGWVKVDPTAAIAPERINQDLNVDLQVDSGTINFYDSDMQQANLSWLKRLHFFWNSVDYNWQRWVINYDNRNQNLILELLGIKSLRMIAFWLLGSVALITVVLAWFLLKDQRQKVEPAVAVYRKFLAKLAKHGLVIYHGEAPKTFAKRVAYQQPELAAAVSEIIRLFVRLRYEPKPTDADWVRFKKKVANFK